jgi:formate C-acetyltransferase
VLDERFAVYFIWKTVALSHTIPDFPRLLRSGTSGLRREIEEELRLRTDGDAGKRNALAAMLLTLEGVEAWARNLSAQAAALARAATDPVRRAELSRLSEICARVPAEPARTLDEAVNAIWMGLVAVHMENGNCAISLGRLDQWLQPFLAAEMARCQSAAERQALVEHAIELVGCLFLRCADHLPLVPDIGNYLFGGSSSDQAITLGGVTPEGGDAVNDMTYIFLKVTEMLGVRDPNVNARYSPGVNSDNYLRRLCEVNLITAATPSMHNDDAVLAALAPFGYPLEDRRDWAATGCVEPTLSGRHMSNTGSVMLNLVAALEMALGDGRHPLMDWAVGPRTGVVKRGDFRTFEDFFEAFASQLRFLVDQSAQYNLWLGEAHATLRPTPLLSALLEGCITSGRDATRGGARLNSSGTTCIGLADVTDSLMAVKKLVFDDKKLSFAELQEAVDANFVGHAPVAAMARARVPLFGSGSEESVELANRIMRLVGECFGRHRNYRNGPYAVGYWTMSNHVVFGALTGALPSGRLAGKAFTPGLTPQPIASRNFLDNLRDVARLDPRAMGNNMAFNVKIAPGGDDDHAGIVERMRAYVGTYFALGGMQMQMNVVTAETLRDAMRNPEAYRHLLVRISGYNAYFVTLNTDMQVELIERAEYGI